MSDRFFDEYQVTFRVRIAAPSNRPGNFSAELFDALSDAISARRDILVGVASIMIDPIKGEPNERSKTGF